MKALLVHVAGQYSQRSLYDFRKVARSHQQSYTEKSNTSVCFITSLWCSTVSSVQGKHTSPSLAIQSLAQPVALEQSRVTPVILPAETPFHQRKKPLENTLYKWITSLPLLRPICGNRWEHSLAPSGTARQPPPEAHPCRDTPGQVIPRSREACRKTRC